VVVVDIAEVSEVKRPMIDLSSVLIQVLLQVMGNQEAVVVVDTTPVTAEEATVVTKEVMAAIALTSRTVVAVVVSVSILRSSNNCPSLHPAYQDQFS
jgi:hypothetical protein